MFGEVTGHFDPVGTNINAQRLWGFSWMTGPMPTHWLIRNFAGTVEYNVLEKRWWKYSSPHVGLMQWALADGSVRSTSVSIDRNVTLYASAMADGQVSTLQE